MKKIMSHANEKRQLVQLSKKYVLSWYHQICHIHGLGRQGRADRQAGIPLRGWINGSQK